MDVMIRQHILHISFIKRDLFWVYFYRHLQVHTVDIIFFNLKHDLFILQISHIKRDLFSFCFDHQLEVCTIDFSHQT